jgi:hypothetical protein
MSGRPGEGAARSDNENHEPTPLCSAAVAVLQVDRAALALLRALAAGLALAEAPDGCPILRQTGARPRWSVVDELLRQGLIDHRPGLPLFDGRPQLTRRARRLLREAVRER